MYNNKHIVLVVDIARDIDGRSESLLTVFTAVTTTFICVKLCVTTAFVRNIHFKYALFPLL